VALSEPNAYSESMQSPVTFLAKLRRMLTDVACLLACVVLRPVQRRRATALKADPLLGSILVFNDVRGLGNLIMLSGLLLNLRRLYPAATIAVAMPSSSLAPAIIGPKLADEFLFFDPEGSRRQLLRFAWRVLRPRRFDLGLATFFSPTLLTSCVLALAGCRYRVAYSERTHRGFLNAVTLLDRGGHELDRHLRLLEFTGQRLIRQTELSVSIEAVLEAEKFLALRGLGSDRPLVGVHPGCDRANALKRWPVERFVAVINEMVTTAVADVAVFLGPDEMDLSTALAAELEPRVPVICFERFELTAVFIGRCQAFLSNDSGLMHVAAALNVPVVAIFGPTDTVKNAPVGIATLLTASGVPCRPCYAGRPVTCTQPQRYCLENICVDEVTSAVEQILTPLVRSTSARGRVQHHA